MQTVSIPSRHCHKREWLRIIDFYDEKKKLYIVARDAVERWVSPKCEKDREWHTDSNKTVHKEWTRAISLV